MLGPELELGLGLGRVVAQAPEVQIGPQRGQVGLSIPAGPDAARLGQFPRLAPSIAWE